jgi:hypothetical protein
MHSIEKIMVRNRRDSDDPLAGHLFWSRRGGRDLSAEVDFDRPCPVCGYKLRGRPLRTRCPECGATGGWAIDDEPIAWDERQTLGAFISTAAMILFHPHRIARHVWLNRRLNLQAARRFRRICIGVAAISFSIVAVLLTGRTLNWQVAGCSALFQSLAIILWLNAVTLEPMARLKVWSGESQISRRVQTIAYYFPAALLLSVIHLAGLIWWNDLQYSGVWLLIGAFHVSVLAVQLWICSLGLGWMTYELIDMPKVQAHMMAMGWVIGASVQAVIMLIGVPAMVALVMQHLVGSP